MISSIIALPLLMSAPSAIAGNLTIDVKNIRGIEGKLQVTVFNQQ